MEFNFKKIVGLLGGMLLSCLVTLQSAYAFRAPGTYSHYGFVESGPFANIDIYTTWVDVPAPGVSGGNVFPAFQFWFQAPGSNGGPMPGYIGTVLGYDGTSRGVNFSIWDRDDDPRTDPTATWDSATSPGCKSFDNEGLGVQCPLLNYNWVTGREYRLNVVSAGFDATGENWRGEITDTVTGVTTVMGVIHLANTPATQTTPSYTGYGRLTGGTTFLEYYTAKTCTGNPAAKVLWRGPYAENETLVARYAMADYRPYDGECANHNVTTSTTGAPIAIHSIGDTVQETVAAGQDIWNPPLVTTKPVTKNSTSCATLNATINTWGLADNISFQYGTSTAFGSTSASTQITSTTAAAASSSVCGLSKGTVYYARAVGTYTNSANGTVYPSYGETYKFTLDKLGNVANTLLLPVVSATGVSSIQQTTATLTGTLNTNGSSGGIYGMCKVGTGAYVTVGSKTVPATNGAISVGLTGLVANTTYACHINARNHGATTTAVGTPDVSFTTSVDSLVSPPVAYTGTASSVKNTSATLNGTCDFKGAAGTPSAWFEYYKVGTTTYYNSVPQYFSALSTSINVTQAISGLSGRTTYNFRVHCSNAGGNASDFPVSFTTPR